MEGGCLRGGATSSVIRIYVCIYIYVYTYHAVRRREGPECGEQQHEAGQTRPRVPFLFRSCTDHLLDAHRWF